MLTVRRAFGIVVLLISLVLLVWGTWPQGASVRTTPIQQYSENRSMILEWTPWLRVGDAGTLRVTFAPDQDGNNLILKDEIESASGYLAPEDLVPISPTNTILEASIDISGIQVVPLGEISESLYPGRPAMFQWKMYAPRVGTYNGTIWIHVRNDSRDTTFETREVLSAPRVEIKAINFMGLSGSTARILGSVGVVLGSFLGLDGVFSWLWNMLVRSAKPVS